VDLLQRAAHTLKSTSATLGATSFSELCQELEAIAQTGTLTVASARVSQLKTEYEKVEMALLEQLLLLKAM
jgi:HPt (histidine-containing phosphotransfer) domain-containing protein